jgi:hypothetical protein
MSTMRVAIEVRKAGPSSHRMMAFRARYFRELDSKPESWQPIVSATRRGTVTLIYSSHDEEHNNAVALQEYCKRKEGDARPPREPSRRAARDERLDKAGDPPRSEGGDLRYLHAGNHGGHFLRNIESQPRVCIEVADMEPVHRGHADRSRIALPPRYAAAGSPRGHEPGQSWRHQSANSAFATTASGVETPRAT